MATTSIARSAPSTPRHRGPRNPFAGVDRAIERVIGVDMKLIYGMFMPMLLVCAVIVALAFRPSEWIVAATVVLELGCLALIVVKLMAMLGDEEEG